MASKEEGFSSKPRRRRRLSWIPTCFGGPPSPGSGSADLPARASRFSRRRWFRAKKRTVPVDAAADETAGGAPKEAPAPARKSFFQKFRKDKSSENRSSPHQHHQAQNPAPAKTVATAEPHRLQVRRVASKCDARSQPPPLYRMRDAARTGTRTSHPGSPERGRCTANHGRPWKKCDETMGCLGSCVGLRVLAAALALTLLLGRPCAIVCMSAWLYLLPRFRAATRTAARNAASGKGDGEIDMSSEEYKKRVVLMGLLQREGRRPSVTIPVSSR